jgi:hypothetical protein
LSFGQNVTITKVIETGCPDPFVKTVELYVDGTVDFSTDVVLNYMQNGGTWEAIQIDISSLGIQTDTFVYIVRDIALMQAEFPSTTFDASNTVVVTTATNGDDGYQIVLNGTVVSQFGETLTDGTGEPWEHVDAVATRKDGIPDLGVFDITHWDVTPLQSTDSETACEGGSGLEAWFSSLGATFPLGSGSGWTPTGDVCTTVLVSDSVTCQSFTVGANNDTYDATVAFTGGNTGNTFTVSTTAGTVGGDNPTNVESGNILITNIPEGTDITVTVSDTGDGGVCNLTRDVTSPDCIPLVLNEMLFDPATDLTGDANGDGVRDASDDEFVELFNNSGTALDLSGYTLSDAAQLRHTFPTPTIIPANGVLVLFGGGTPTGTFGGSIVQTASEGALNLNNNGDAIIIANPDGRVAINFNSSDIPVSFGQDQSVTRNPDITGDFVLHTDANASLLFSPGLRANGSTLSNDEMFIQSVSIYPNPVQNGILYIDYPSNSSKAIALFDINGRKVLETNLNSNMLDLTNVLPGFYLLNITIDGLRNRSKLIIK